MPAHALEARDLSCRRGDRLLFAALDLCLDAGEAVHLVGPNGVGKTSLLRILAGLLPPSPYGGSGRLAWQGRVGLLDGSAALDPALSLVPALAFWGAIDGGPMPLERLGLDDLLDVPVRYLSTGQTRRAGLARLLGQRAEHWLLDEPLNGLDTEGARLLAALIAERRSAGGVVIVASHQPIALPSGRVIDLRDYRA